MGYWRRRKWGISVPRNERDGSFMSDSITESVRLVMVEEEGRIYVERIKEMKDSFVNTKGHNRYIDNLLRNLKSSLKC